MNFYNYCQKRNYSYILRFLDDNRFKKLYKILAQIQKNYTCKNKTNTSN